jgi:hypothetical protein
MHRIQMSFATDIISRLHQELGAWVTELQPFSAADPLPDSTLKFLAFDQMRRPFGVVVCSQPLAPAMVASSIEWIAMARRALGPLGGVVLEPLKSGMVGDLSYAVFPYCRKLYDSRWAWDIQRPWVRSAVLAWLRDATAMTMDHATDQEREDLFRSPLSHLAGAQFPPVLRDAVSIALRRLEQDLWQPRVCLMHGDLWKGNVLLAPGSRDWHEFVLIDWPGCLVRGHAIYDLMRLALSMSLKGRRLERELRAHCRILECEFIDALSYLLAALGYIGKNLNYFPVENFMKMSIDCFNRYSSLRGARFV